MGEGDDAATTTLKNLPWILFFYVVAPHPDELGDGFGGLLKCLFLLACYGYVLFTASNVISDGSELLLLIPSLAGIVGSIVLPVLGAVPDAAIIIFSGLGPRDEAQKQLNVGVGALAGSTVMLLTVPWVLSLVAGRVSLVDGVAQYKRKPKLSPADSFGLHDTGVAARSSIAQNAHVMLVTVTPYILIQVPAIVYQCGKKSEVDEGECRAHSERPFALAGLIVCAVMLAGYLVLCWYQSKSEEAGDKAELVKQKAIDSGMISLSAAFAEDLIEAAKGHGDIQVRRTRPSRPPRVVSSKVLAANAHDTSLNSAGDEHGSAERAPLLRASMSGSALVAPEAHMSLRRTAAGEGMNERARRRFNETLRLFFNRYDRNGDGTIDADELQALLNDFGDGKGKANDLLTQMDQDQSGTIEWEEFREGITAFVLQKARSGGKDHAFLSNAEHGRGLAASSSSSSTSSSSSSAAGRTIQVRVDADGQPSSSPLAEQQQRQRTVPSAVDGDDNDGDDNDDDDDDEEEEDDDEIPEDLVDLPVSTQRRRILLRSLWMMSLGTIVVMIYSDLMVDVLNNLGTRTHIPAFYISFVLAPLASNASELIAAYNYALKKTSKTITVSLSTLEGAAIMNNTFCLGVFLGLVYGRELAWEFTAETIAIVVVQLAMWFVALRPVQPLYFVFIIGSLYPLCVAIVAILEGPVGLD